MKLCLLFTFAQLWVAFAKRRSKPFEGDIDLRGLPIQSYVKSFEYGNKKLYGSYVQKNAIKGNVFRWKNGVIPYEISDTFGTRDRNIIQSAIEDYNQKTCIRWVQKSDEMDYVIIEDSGNGCLSPLGRQGGPQYLDLGEGCVSKGLIIHEMMHVLGFFHEQSRKDREDFVEIIWDNIDKVTGRHNFDFYDGEIEDLGYKYDYGSIMHYGSRDFSKDGSITVQPLDRSAKIGQREELSRIDAKKINKLYKCKNFDISGDSKGEETIDFCFKTLKDSTIIDGNPFATTKADSYTACISMCIKTVLGCLMVVFDYRLKTCSQYDKKFSKSLWLYKNASDVMFGVECDTINKPGSVTNQLWKNSEYSKKNEPGSVTKQLRKNSEYSKKNDCPPEWTKKKDTCYKIFPGLGGHDSALSKCTSNGAHLPFLRDMEDFINFNEFLKEKYPSKRAHMWLDGKNDDEVAVFKVQDPQTNEICQLPFTNWAPQYSPQSLDECIFGVFTTELKFTKDSCGGGSGGFFVCQIRKFSLCEPGSVTKQLRKDSEYSKKNELLDCFKKIEGFTIIGGHPVAITSADSDRACASKCLSSGQGCQHVVFDHQTGSCTQYALSYPDSRAISKTASVIMEVKSGSECSEKTSNANCVDNNNPKQCDDWAKQGYCFTKRDIMMQTSCSKTCMYCGSCEDIYKKKYCQFYKDNGFCSKFEEIMSYGCMQTCNKCFI